MRYVPEICAAASAFLYETPGQDAESYGFSAAFLNVLLAEALPAENSIRRAEGREPLAEAPVLKGLDEEVPYSGAIVRIALPYGLASWYFQQELDNFQAENYRARYIAALEDAKRCCEESIEEVYGGWS